VRQNETFLALVCKLARDFAGYLLKTAFSPCRINLPKMLSQQFLTYSQVLYTIVFIKTYTMPIQKAFFKFLRKFFFEGVRSWKKAENFVNFWKFAIIFLIRKNLKNAFCIGIVFVLLILYIPHFLRSNYI